MSRGKDSSTLLFGIVTTCIGFAVMGVTNSPLLSLLSMGLATVGEVFWLPVSQSLSQELPDPDHRSAYMAFMGLSYSGKQVFGSLAVALGAWLPSVAMSGLFVLTGVVSFVLLNAVIKKVVQQKTAQTASSVAS